MSDPNANILTTSPNTVSVASTFDSAAVRIDNLYQCNTLKVLSSAYFYQVLGQITDAQGVTRTIGLIDPQGGFYSPTNINAAQNLIAGGNLTVNGITSLGALNASTLTATGLITAPTINATTISSPRWKSTMVINKTSAGALPITATYNASAGSLKVELQITVQFQSVGLLGFTPGVGNILINYIPANGTQTLLGKCGMFFSVSSTNQYQLNATYLIPSGYQAGAMTFSLSSDNTQLTTTSNSQVRLVVTEMPF